MLEIQNLTVEFDTPMGAFRAVDDVSYSVEAGEVVGVVGESGSGKSVTVQTVMRLVPEPPARIVSGRIMYGDEDLLTMNKRQLRRLRGREIAMIAQEPIAALNPLFKVGTQIAEAITAHDPKVSRRAALKRAVELLTEVQVPDAASRIGEYPHQFSGGMAQRVCIAMAMANSPRLLIADEPSTALDVTVQAQVMRTLRRAQQASGAAMILITHDLALIAELAHRVVVMYGGRVVETGPVREIFANPIHPYTRGLLRSIPRLDGDRGRLYAIPGSPPTPESVLPGCAFAPRCDLSRGRERCTAERPAFHVVGAGRGSACHFVDEMAGATAASSESPLPSERHGHE